MRVLLVVHDCNAPYNVFPYGIGYLAAAMRNAGHKVAIYDQAITHASTEDLYAYIRNEPRFDMIGMGFQAAYFHVCYEVAQTIKKACGAIPFVLGGSAPSASPEYFLDKFNADYVLVGEAENSINKLLKIIEGKEDPQSVPGLYWRAGEEIRHSLKIPPPENLDDLSFPAWDLFDMQSYTFPRRQAGVDHLCRAFGMLTTRGCPYACKFCFRLEPGFRMRSKENVIEELKYLIGKYNVNFVSFHDDLFMASKKRTLDMCEAFLESGLKFNWLCNGRFNIADNEQLKIMRKSGCVLISYGLESGDQKILNEMDKRITVQQMYEVARLTKEEGILVTVPAMFGLPGETKESIHKTVDVILATTSFHDKRTLRPMQPYPGSFYYRDCVQKGLLKDENDFYGRYFSSEKWTVNLSDIHSEELDKVVFEANERLLRAHFERELEDHLNMFRNVYFAHDAMSFIPMR